MTNDQVGMKAYRLFIGVVLAAAGLVSWGCEENDIDRDCQGPYFVRFTDSTLTFRESFSKPVTIRVHNVGPQLDQPITVTYTVAGTAREGTDFAFEGTKGTVVIPAKSSFGEIRLRLINNANNILESQNLVFTLTGVQPSSLQVGFGKEGVVGRKMTLTIQDDCLLSGTYTGSRQAGTATVSEPDIDISSTNCRDYLLTNWNVGIFGVRAVRPTLRFVDNGDNSLTIPPQRSEFLEAPYDTLRGVGSWNPRDRRITLRLQLKFPIPNTNPQRDTLITTNLTYIPQ